MERGFENVCAQNRSVKGRAAELVRSHSAKEGALEDQWDGSVPLSGADAYKQRGGAYLSCDNDWLTEGSFEENRPRIDYLHPNYQPMLSGQRKNATIFTRTNQRKKDAYRQRSCSEITYDDPERSNKRPHSVQRSATNTGAPFLTPQASFEEAPAHSTSDFKLNQNQFINGEGHRHYSAEAVGPNEPTSKTVRHSLRRSASTRAHDQNEVGPEPPRGEERRRSLTPGPNMMRRDMHGYYPEPIDRRPRGEPQHFSRKFSSAPPVDRPRARKISSSARLERSVAFYEDDYHEYDGVHLADQQLMPPARHHYRHRSAQERPATYQDYVQDHHETSRNGYYHANDAANLPPDRNYRFRNDNFFTTPSRSVPPDAFKDSSQTTRRRRLPAIPNTPPVVNLSVPEIKTVPPTPSDPETYRTRPTRAGSPRETQTRSFDESSQTVGGTRSRHRRCLPQDPPDFSHSLRQASFEQIDRETPPQSQTPPPAVARSNGTPGYQPSRHTSQRFNFQRHTCQRRGSDQTLECYMGTTCTCDFSDGAGSQADCSTSTDNFESKSSTDAEESTTATPASPAHSTMTQEDSMEQRSTTPEPPSERPPSPKAVAAAVVNEVRAWPEVETHSGGFGCVKFSVQYFPLRKRLRVWLNRADNLGGQLQPEKEWNTFVKVSLMPGKVQKQQSRVVKGRNVLFNEEFFFDNVSSSDINVKTLELKVCHASSKARHDVIGGIEIDLRDVNGLLTKKEIRLAREVKPKISKKLGKLQVVCSIEKEAKRLTVNIIKAFDLPKLGLTGPPDPCVKVTLDQDGVLQHKQTRTLKCTRNAVFKEAIMFLVITTPHILEKTSVRLSVRDMGRSNAVVGEAYLGHLAKDKSEQDQWRHMLTSFGKEFKATHQLKLVAPDQT